MKLATLLMIKTHLEDEEHRQGTALDLARKVQKERLDRLGEMTEYQENYTDEEFEKQKELCHFQNELCRKIVNEYCAAKEALEDFQAHDWN